MFKILKSTFLALMLLCTTTHFAMAVEYVYVTKSGTKYHHAESRFIKNKESVEKLTLEEALERGLNPSKAYIKHKQKLEKQSEQASK